MPDTEKVREITTADLETVAGGQTETDADAASWVPADACTLPTAQQPLRLAEFTELFAESLRVVERPNRTELLLGLDEAAGDRVRDLVARESGCCSFFGFDVTGPRDGIVWLRVDVPSARADVLDGLAAQADGAMAARAGD